MADRTVDLNYVDRIRGSLAMQATNAEVFYKGSLVGISLSTGYIVSWSDAAAIQFLGLATGGVTGDTSATPPTEVKIDSRGQILKRINVTGTSAITHVGDKVFCATDNPEDFKVAANTNNKAIGEIVRWHSAAICDVRLYTPGEYRGQVPIADITVLTDSSGGTASDTLADVTEANNAGSADRVPTENAIASLAAKVNAILAYLNDQQ